MNTKKLQDFVMPKSIREAEDRSLELKKAIMSIELQLNEKRFFRTDRNGVAMPQQKYIEWRTRALFMLTSMRCEVMELRKWVKDRRLERLSANQGVTDPKDSVQILKAARTALLSVKNTGHLSDRERADLGQLADMIEQHLVRAA